MPQCIKEGAAELVHGIDDYKRNRLKELALSSNSENLNSALNYYGEEPPVDVYAGGYMLLRYLAMQVLDGSDSRFFASSSNSPVSMTTDSMKSGLSSDADLLYDNAVGIVEDSNQLASISGDLSDAMVSFGGSCFNSFITNSASGLFESKKSYFLS